MPPSSCGSCTVAILGMHKKIRHLKYEHCWLKHQLMKNREKIQIWAGILCWASWGVSFSSCYIAEVTPMRRARRARTGLLQEVLKAPCCGQRDVGGFEGSWATAWSWDKLGLRHYSPFPREWEGRRPPWSSRLVVRHECLGKRWVWNCHSTGIAHHSWNWKIRMCQCVMWINEDEMCCINTSGAWSCRYPLGYSGSQGEKVDLYL